MAGILHAASGKLVAPALRRQVFEQQDEGSSILAYFGAIGGRHAHIELRRDFAVKAYFPGIKAQHGSGAAAGGVFGRKFACNAGRPAC